MGVQVNGKTSSPFGCHPLSSVSLWDFLIPPTYGWLLPSCPEWLEGRDAPGIQLLLFLL